MENNKCLKPPTRVIVYSTSLSRYICVCVMFHLYCSYLVFSTYGRLHGKGSPVTNRPCQTWPYMNGIWWYDVPSLNVTLGNPTSGNPQCRWIPTCLTRPISGGMYVEISIWENLGNKFLNFHVLMFGPDLKLMLNWPSELPAAAMGPSLPWVSIGPWKNVMDII